ncbi:hypothetical protein EJ02DRAFT_463950 [Clathrospora elynae]|uniref:Secreted protein n=1 Tax=Clathrospora elynae TaxID=706981 RepID=A0A6A5SXN5_9PLEO|nr:hypothetical protein EJ02DRAFT_463950 [Clathrospora elynae]
MRIFLVFVFVLQVVRIRGSFPLTSTVAAGGLAGVLGTNKRACVFGVVIFVQGARCRVQPHLQLFFLWDSCPVARVFLFPIVFQLQQFNQEGLQVRDALLHVPKTHVLTVAIKSVLKGLPQTPTLHGDPTLICLIICLNEGYSVEEDGVGDPPGWAHKLRGDIMSAEFSVGYARK